MANLTIQERLERIRFFEVTPDFSSLTLSEQKALAYCLKAAQEIHGIFLDQVHPRNREWLRLAKDRGEHKSLIRYFEMNCGPWDRFRDNEQFLPVFGEKLPGAGFYPPDLTKEEWHTWLDSHPEDREAFESPYTVIERDSRGDLVATPYSRKWEKELARASSYLTQAAKYLPNGKLKKFLLERADAFVTNDYRQSDITWAHTGGHPFEVTIGPYEVYEDNLLGLKATFEAFIGIPDEDASMKLRKLAKYISAFDQQLARRVGYAPRGLVNPIVVVNDVLRSGEAYCGRQLSAYNLPNDQSIHQEVGSKNVFSQALAREIFETLIKPAEEKLYFTSRADNSRFDGHTLFILGHELAHGVELEDKRLHEFRSPLEEEKANCVGIAFLEFLVEQKEITRDELEEVIILQVAAIARGWRTGLQEADTAGELVEYNWLKNAGAVCYNQTIEKFEVDTNKALGAYKELALVLLKLQKEDTYESTKKFWQQWCSVPPEMSRVVEQLQHLPLEVYPVFNLESLPKVE